MKLTYSGLILCFCFSLFSGLTAQAGAPVKSYREWKTQRFQTANNQISSLKNRLTIAQNFGNKNQAENLKKEIDQEQWNADVAKDLSVTDYFVLYLSQIPDTDRFKQAASKMDIAEIEEMMKAYSEAVGAVAPQNDRLSQSTKLPVQAGEIREQMK